METPWNIPPHVVSTSTLPCMSGLIATEPHANSRDGGRNVVRMKHKGRATLSECFTFQRKEKAKIDRGTLIPSCLSCGNRHALFFFSIGPNQWIAPTPCPEVMSLRQSWLDWVGADGVGRIGDTYTHTLEVLPLERLVRVTFLLLSLYLSVDRWRKGEAHVTKPDLRDWRSFLWMCRCL